MTDQTPNAQFHASSFLQGANAQYVDQLAARYAADPGSVDAGWAASRFWPPEGASRWGGGGIDRLTKRDGRKS